MRLQSLNHLLGVVKAIADPDKIYIFGSAALLPAHPELGEAGQPLSLTQDGDLLLEPIDDALAGVLQEAVGKEGAFMQHFGYHADILRPIFTETLPEGWESRLHPVWGYENVFAIDPYDLALVKLVIGRDKDVAFVRTLLNLNILQTERLRKQYHEAPLGEREGVAAGRNPTLLLREMNAA